MGRSIHKIFLTFTLVVYQISFAKCDVEEQTVPVLNELDNPSNLLSVSVGCEGYGINNLPHPRIILLGPTGVGKSTLANQLLGRNNNDDREQVFSVGHSSESHTVNITWVVGRWLGDGPCFTIIDTPGSSDSEGRDYEHALAMANIMKNSIKSVDIFLLCFHGGQSRFDQSVIELLKLYESIYSKKMWDHAITEVTYWQHDRRNVKNRKKNRKIDEMIRHEQWNSQYKDELNVTIEIPSVYIDPVLPIFDAEEADYIEEREKKAFAKYTNELFEYANNTPPFFCDGNCKAPNGYFLGNPWIKINNITRRQGEKAIINCQIWNGLQGTASDNVTLTHNGKIIYEKIKNKYEAKPLVNSTDVWGSKVKFVENKSPGEGHYTDFSIEFESLEESMEGNYTCENGKVTDDNVANVFMKVDGTWEQWGPWNKCSKRCLAEDGKMGTRKKVRKAIPPRYGGKPVNKTDGEITENCAGDQGHGTIKYCPKHFSWSMWTRWSNCSRPCGSGIKYRKRFCNEGAHGGTMCPKSIEEASTLCHLKKCPIDGTWGPWGSWDKCSKTCMDEDGKMGTRKKLRKAILPRYGGKPVNQSDGEFIEKCAGDQGPETIKYCPKDFSWSVWARWSNCSRPCGSGIKYRKRFCIEGAHGGIMCPKSIEEDTTSCHLKMCPVDGTWGQWEPWNKCSKICMDEDGQMGTRKKVRKAIPPRYGGKSVNKEDAEVTEKCAGDQGPGTIKYCPKDFSWSVWSRWSSCSKNCGSGIKYRKRFCIEGAHGGVMCPKSIEEASMSCHLKMCPVDGTWGPWGSWDKCSKTCMDEDGKMGTRKKIRKAIPPRYEGKPVNQADEEITENCIGDLGPGKIKYCPKNFSWAAWTGWSSCSRSCGSGSKYRKRFCNEGTHGGTMCPQNRIEKTSKSCYLKHCPPPPSKYYCRDKAQGFGQCRYFHDIERVKNLEDAAKATVNVGVNAVKDIGSGLKKLFG